MSRPIRMTPISDAARDGRYQLVSDGEEMAVVRWNGERWEFGSGVIWPRVAKEFYAGESRP